MCIFKQIRIGNRLFFNISEYQAKVIGASKAEIEAALEAEDDDVTWAALEDLDDDDLFSP